MKNSSFKENVYPALVLVCICLVVTAALAATYSVTNPVIVQSQIDAANATRSKVLPDGDTFTKYDGELTEGVSECYTADNESGIVVTASYKGFGGPVEVMTGISKDGKVTGVSITNHSETPGLGTKAMTEDYLSHYVGTEDASASSIKDDPNLDGVSGASFSSNAIYHSVGYALAQFKAMNGGAN